MSPLTKTFVMLLVVSSLLNAAAIVVYVNKEQVTEKDKEALNTQLESVKRERDLARSAAQESESQLQKQQQLAATEAADKQSQLDKAAADLASKDADNKQLLRNSQAQEGNYQAVSAQLAVALDTIKTDDQNLSKLRDDYNDHLKKWAESETSAADKQKLADTYQRQVEYDKEQIKKAQDTIRAYSSVIEQNHLTLPAETPPSVSGAPVSGVVQDKQVVNGVTYLTISVGASDSVQPGMEFRVVDTKSQPQQFLGILTITSADTNTSIGRLQSDEQLASRVDKGVEVTSELH